METDAIAGVSFALVYFAVAFETNPCLQIRGSEVEGCACPALTCLAVAQINALRVTRGDNAERPAVTLPISFHESLLVQRINTSCDASSCVDPPKYVGVAVKAYPTAIAPVSVKPR
jgi:hypothetical protein